MDICKDCGAKYDHASVTIPSPLPDRVCATCGTQLSVEKVAELVQQRVNEENQDDD